VNRTTLLPVLLAAALGAPTVAWAQSNPVLREALQLAAEGRGDSARALVNGVLAQARPGDTTYVEALFFRARIAGPADSAATDLRRVAFDYSGSRWADDALLQLSQLALTSGNPATAFELAERVRSDYPGSTLRPHAGLWAARAAFEIGEPRQACLLLDSVTTEAAGDVEFLNQVSFYRARCTAEVLAQPAPRPAAADSAAAPTAKPPATPAPAPAAIAPVRARYDVQVAATSSASAARDLARRLTAAGYRARVVLEGRLHKVRVGPYTTEAAADSAARATRRFVRGTPFVVRQP